LTQYINRQGVKRKIHLTPKETIHHIFLLFLDIF